MLKRVVAACVALVLGAGIYLFYTSNTVQSRPSVKDAQEMVDDVIEYMEKVGPKRVIRDINSGKSHRWHNGALYVFMYQVEPRGYMVAHAVNSALVNKNLYDLTDPEGKLFVKEYLDTAIEKGYSEIPFKWPNPITNKIENKTGICRMTKDKKYVICSGAYSR
jgi:signal transduction histidine kinase